MAVSADGSGYFRAMVRAIMLSAFVVALSTVQAQAVRVLFIGNSYTSANNLPEMTRQLALSLGDALVVQSSAPGGHTFQQHTANPATLALIRQGNWDFVVLQEQSQLPSFPPAQVAAQCLPYAAQLVDSVRAYSPCAVPVFYMTWGRRDGDAQNCAGWPPVCTYAGMQQQLRGSYLQMAMDNQAACAPVGAAWQQVRATQPSVDLYVSDGSHPSVAGSYLAASVLYTTMFRRSALGAQPAAGLPATTATTLQQMAASTVLDSLATWNIGADDPVAQPHYTLLGNGTAQFTETSLNATAHQWIMPDGSTVQQASFQYQFTTAGTFEVVYVASDNCGRADTALVTVEVTGLGVVEETRTTFRLNPVPGQLLAVQNDGPSGTLELFDLQGRLLLVQPLAGPEHHTLARPCGEGALLWRFTSARAQLRGKLPAY